MKGLALLIRIAARNLLRNPRRSLLTIAAIAFGLFCLIVFQALKVGLHHEMVTSIQSLDAASLQIHAQGYETNLAVLKPIPSPLEIGALLKKQGLTSAPRIKAPALVLSGQKSSTVLLSGVEPKAEAQVTRIASSLRLGRYLEDGGILIGEELARSLEVGIGDSLTLMVQDAGGRPATRRYDISGIYSTAQSSFDRSRVYLRISDARMLLGAEAVTTEIAIATEQDAAATAKHLEQLLPPASVQIRPWQLLAPDLMQIIELNNATMNLLILIVFFIVALGIANTIAMVIFERVRELGTLMALGTSNQQILSMILLEAFFLGIISALIATGAASLCCLYLGNYGVDLTAFTSENQYFATSHVLKTMLKTPDLVRANLITLATAVAAALVPALRALRRNPAEALRQS